MMKIDKPDYLFEVSWEVCNKVGGIHTVIATKSLYLAKEYGDKHIHIGPDVWRDTETNPEFTEDNNLFRSWRLSAAEEGIRARVGRWNVEGNPIAILVDFSTLIPKKDDILTELWKQYGVDSLNGNWDYIESALFGYAAGRVIESFARYNLKPTETVAAQFHEWMTGAGLLYLKMRNMPFGTVFTTHATVVGRCIAGKNMPLYDSLESFNADQLARDFGVGSRHSLEKAAAQASDVFTTVSDITAKECKQFLGRAVDIVTPNGFENSFTPSDEEYPEVFRQARQKLTEVAAAMTGSSIEEDAVFVGISGRYEYCNKGINVFLDSLAKLKAEGGVSRQVVAFVMVPSGNNGPDKQLLEKLSGNDSEYKTQVSHYLMDDYDAVMSHLRRSGLTNEEGDRVKVLFFPTYLNGNDGIFNKKYYDLLPGMDLTVFPSYYEPWGYTPLESLAFAVPTTTTSLAGFGLWVEDHYDKAHPGIAIVRRTDVNYDEVVEGVKERILEIASLDATKEEEYRNNAREVSTIALWEHNVIFYKNAYREALDKIYSDTSGKYKEIVEEQHHSFSQVETSRPNWTSILVGRNLPDRLKTLDTLAHNLWWCWNQEAIDLFKSIDGDLWKQVGGNPLLLLDRIPLKLYHKLENDAQFLARLDAVFAQFSAYMAEKDSRTGAKVAYFCMEYGIDTSLKIYSGGLGILAGDYLKEASDMKVNMTAIGLLYRYGYFTQKLSAGGSQISSYEPQDFAKIPASPVRDAAGNWLKVSLAFPGRNLNARLWKVDVGRTDLYLLDTDYEDNLPEDRQVTHQLYGGNWENRLKQELLLGIGGIHALRQLGIEPDVYHCNEGHAAFCGLERMREFIQEKNLSFAEALEAVRASSLFTTHTPVPAGHDAFTEDLLRVYMSHYPEKMKTDWTSFMSLGKINPQDQNEKFSMSFLAANLSQEVNGVSWLHGKVSQDIFAPMWPGYLPEELHVSSVTNGVHYPTWTAPEWKAIHAEVFGEEFKTHHYDKRCFEGIYNVADERIWNTRNLLRHRLIEAVKECMADTEATAHYSPREIVKIRKTLRDDVLTIGFARRFATYKRATLLFSNLDRLNEIVNNPERPVQFLFAGKAHPADGAGQDLIRRIVEISKMPQFIGKIVFVPNYDISIAKLLVQGVDVWMNNPTRPQEASGTSGEKAVMNGVMHFSVLDGWWVEGYKPGAGWALKMERTYDDQSFQNELDAATIYNIIETEIAPTFYEKDAAKGYSPEWIMTIKNTVAQVACNFTTNRMLSDYCSKYYEPLAKRYAQVIAGDFRFARDMAFWKKRMRREWDSIQILSFTRPDDVKDQLTIGSEFSAELKAFIGDVNPEDLGVELLFCERDRKGKLHIVEKYDFQLADFTDGVATYKASIVPEVAGSYEVAGRLFAYNPDFPHRQDFELVKWL